MENAARYGDYFGRSDANVLIKGTCDRAQLTGCAACSGKLPVSLGDKGFLSPGDK